MNKIRKSFRAALATTIVFGACFAPWRSLRASVQTFYGRIAVEVGLAFSNNYSLDLGKNSIDKLSAQVNVSSASYTTQTFGDGTQSTASITVASFTALAGSRGVGALVVTSPTALGGIAASNFIQVSSNSCLAGTFAFDQFIVTSTINSTAAIVTFNDLTFAASRQFNLGASSAATNVNLANALRANPKYQVAVATFQTGTSMGITLTSLLVGATYNAWTLTSSTVAIISTLTPTFVGGSDPVGIQFNGSTVTIYQWPVATTASGTAVNIAAALNGEYYGVNADTGPTNNFVNGSTVSLRMRKVGSFYNSYTLASSSPSALSVNSSSFTGGQDPVTIQVAGKSYQFGVDIATMSTTTDTAFAIFSKISSDTYLTTIYFTTNGYYTSNWGTPPLSTGVVITTISYGIILTTWTNAGTVKFTAVSSGSAYVYPLFTSSAGAIAVTGQGAVTWPSSGQANIGGGWDNASIMIGTVTLVQGTHWNIGADNPNTAAAISTAILNNCPTMVLSTWTGSVIFTTSVQTGLAANYLIRTSSQNALTLNIPFTYGTGVSTIVLPNVSSGPAFGNMQGGTNAGYSTATEIVTISSHGFTNGIAVLFTTAAGAGLTPLFSGATYFVSMISTNSFYLSATSSDVVNGNFINLTSISTQTAGHTFTLTPLPLSGIYAFNWQVSNDSSTWFNLSAGSFSYVSVSTQVYTDFGAVNARYIRLNVQKSTGNGGVNLGVTVNGKN